MPIETLQNDPEDVYNLLLDLVLNGELGAVNYFLGGTVTDVVVWMLEAKNPNEASESLLLI
jgi:hypothetical protein